MEIVKAFLNDYEITNERSDFVLNNDLRKWLKKYGIPVPTLHRHIEKYSLTNGLKYEKARLRHKGTQGLGMCYVKSRVPEKEEIVSLNDEEEQDEPEPEPKPEPKQEKISELDEQYARFTSYTYNPDTLDVFFNSKPVCWISFDPEEEFIILQENNSKELLLKDTLRDYIVNED